MAARKKTSKKKKPKTLHWEQESGWNLLNARQKKQVHTFAGEYRQFLSNVKTEREANDRGVAMAKAAGFKDLAGLIASGKRLKAGDRVYRSIAGKTLVLAVNLPVTPTVVVIMVLPISHFSSHAFSVAARRHIAVKRATQTATAR